MSRRPGILKRNKNNRRYKYFLFLDTESYVDSLSESEEHHSFRLAAGLFLVLSPNREAVHSQTFSFFSPSELANTVSQLAQKHDNLQVVAHNVSYDLAVTNLIPLLMERGWELRSIYAAQTTVIVRLRRKNARLLILDGLNRLRGGIEALGKLVGLEKGKVDFQNVSDDELLEYCKRDVEILARATLQFLQFVSDNDLGGDRLTIAGQALNAFRHRFMNERIYIHNDTKALILERAAYKGGLTKCWHYGKFHDGPYYQLDVNSMYPYVMRENYYPVRLLKTEDNPTPERVRSLCDKTCIIADVTIAPKEPIFAVKRNGLNLYPTTAFRTVVTTPEFVFLYDRGEVVTVHAVAIYKRKRIFQDYVRYFYQLRKQYKRQGNTPYSEICKLFLNSLYGKFGAMETSLKRAPDYDAYAQHDKILIRHEDGTVSNVVFIMGQAYIQTKEKETPYSFPAIAAHVTAYARLLLYSFVEQAGLENCYYSDTDSLIVNREGYRRLRKKVSKSKLGHLKVEAIGDTLEVYGRKNYILGRKVRRKGVSRKSLEANPLSTEKETWPGFLRLLKSPESDEYIVKRQSLKLSLQVLDGIPDSSGQVQPFGFIPVSIPTLRDFLPDLPF